MRELGRLLPKSLETSPDVSSVPSQGGIRGASPLHVLCTASPQRELLSPQPCICGVFNVSVPRHTALQTPTDYGRTNTAPLLRPPPLLLVLLCVCLRCCQTAFKYHWVTSLLRFRPPGKSHTMNSARSRDLNTHERRVSPAGQDTRHWGHEALVWVLRPMPHVV